jgi:hypothetical protein
MKGWLGNSSFGCFWVYFRWWFPRAWQCSVFEVMFAMQPWPELVVQRIAPIRGLPATATSQKGTMSWVDPIPVEAGPARDDIHASGAPMRPKTDPAMNSAVMA